MTVFFNIINNFYKVIVHFILLTLLSIKILSYNFPPKNTQMVVSPVSMVNIYHKMFLLEYSIKTKQRMRATHLCNSECMQSSYSTKNALEKLRNSRNQKTKLQILIYLIPKCLLLIKAKNIYFKFLA